MLKKITLQRERVEDWTVYPFSVPTIASLPEIAIKSRIVFFAGENGTGKSTLLEAIAAHYGFGPEGGNRNLQFQTSDSSRSVERLTRALRLSFDIRTGKGFYFRAESLFSLATQIDEWDKDSGSGGRIIDSYGGVSLHNHSHGETFFTVLDNKFRNSGLFLLDEPEAALSPQRQLSFLILIRDTLRRYKTPSSSSLPTPPSCSATPAPRSSPSTMATSTRSTTKTPHSFRSSAASPTTVTASCKNSLRRPLPSSKNPTSHSPYPQGENFHHNTPPKRQQNTMSSPQNANTRAGVEQSRGV